MHLTEEPKKVISKVEQSLYIKWFLKHTQIVTPRDKQPHPHSSEVFRNHQAIWFPDDFRIQSRVSALREAGE